MIHADQTIVQLIRDSASVFIASVHPMTKDAPRKSSLEKESQCNSVKRKMPISLGERN